MIHLTELGEIDTLSSLPSPGSSHSPSIAHYLFTETFQEGPVPRSSFLSIIDLRRFDGAGAGGGAAGYKTLQLPSSKK